MMVYRSIKNRFIHHLLSTQQYTSQICDNLGARINQITISDFNSFTFGFPKQARETNKIAQFIDLLDDRIATQSQIIKELKTLMKELSRVIFAKNRIGAKPSFFSELYIT